MREEDFLNDSLKKMLIDETDRILNSGTDKLSTAEKILFAISLAQISDIVRPLPLSVSTRVLSACLAIAEMLEGVAKDRK